MYDPPPLYRSLINAIGNTPNIGRKLGETLVNVELVFTLAEALNVHDEPITVGWVLLAGTPTPSDKLEYLSPEQRAMLAHARQIVPLDSRFAWEAALREYAAIPLEYRNYRVTTNDLDEQIIDACKIDPLPHPDYIEKYKTILTTPLAFQRIKARFPEANTIYNFFAETDKGRKRGQVRFSVSQLERIKELEGLKWFDDTREKHPLTIHFDDLKKTARFLDRQERKLGNRVHWVADLVKIEYAHTDGTGIIKTDILEFDGFFHLAGIVSSGKTTLAILIGAYIILNKLDERITFVVGDTNTAVQLAHRFNVWFGGDPAGNDHPVAVPVLGQSTRQTHIERMLVSRDYDKSMAEGQPHWGERWLSPVCPLESLVSWEGEDGIKGFTAGREPCQRLELNQQPGQKRSPKHLCPLFTICPAKQMFRDMPHAKIWITTPGALSQAAMPRHLEDRPIKLGDLVYEQSSLVIFDEAETIVDWFDHTYAHDLSLTNGEHGLIDRLDVAVTDYLRGHRSAAPEWQRWLFAERAATKSIGSILTILDPTHDLGLERLRLWVKTGQFTRNSLSYRLSRRLAGLKEYELRENLSEKQRREEEEQTRIVMQFFEALNKIENPLLPSAPPPKARQEVVGAYDLANIMQQMNSAGQDVDTLILLKRCEEWLDKYFPDLETDLAALKRRLEQSTNKADCAYLKKEEVDQNKMDVARRLFFTLWVVVLDWHLDIVFHEWHRKPIEINVEQPYYSIPRNLRRILPIPATGAQFGLYRAPKARKNVNVNALTQFRHINIGRYYVLNYHRLRTDLDGKRGPNVLAMSGTSYLPDSSRFNLQTSPNGVLLPNDQIKEGLQCSEFKFKPFYSNKGRPINVSGVKRKLAALRNLVDAMIAKDITNGGFLGQVLTNLREKAEIDPERWQDRERLLLFTNSYEQSEIVAKAIQTAWPVIADRVYFLCRGKNNEDYQAQSSKNKLERVDIEQFVDTKGKILVAPMQSIGRGFNILNRNKPQAIAAFGAVLFLIRPMWQPEDLVAMAQEVNRYTIQWSERVDLPPDLAAADGLYRSAIALRRTADELWRDIEHRQSYKQLTYNLADDTITDLHESLRITPRRDLAATTAGLIIQAAGRLLRGGVPFYAYFVDAAWAPLTAAGGSAVNEDASTSLLKAMIDIINDYAHESDVVGNALYGDLAAALSCTTGLSNS